LYEVEFWLWQFKVRVRLVISGRLRFPVSESTPAIECRRIWPVRLGAGILLLAFALVIYLPSFQAPFHFDDRGSVLNNPHVQISDLKPKTLFRAAFQDGLQNRPLSNLSLALNFYFGRLNPAGYHMVNFFFFCFTALGIWLLLERLFARLGFDPNRSWLAAWLCALVWAAHPLNTQAVTYIVQRHTSFAGAFSIWSIYFFHLGLEARKRRLMFYLICGLCTIFAILCKETALAVPGLIFLYKIYFFDELKPGWLRRNIAWVIALAVFYALSAAAVLRPGMVAQLRHDFAYYHISAFGKILSAPRSLFWYLYLIVFPFPQFLSLYHEFPMSTGLLHPAATLFSWVAFLAALLFALARARRHKIISFAVLWYLGSLAVETMPLPIETVNEHRLYLALLSLVVPACSWPVLKGKSLKPTLAWAMVIVLFFGFFTFSRNRLWISDPALWKDTLGKFPEHAETYNNLGTAYIIKGREDLAIKNFNKAIELDPGYASAFNNRGATHNKKGQPDLAIQDFNKAIALDPGYASAYNNLGTVYNNSGQSDLAIRDFDKAIELDPKDASAFNNRGAAYNNKGQPDQAIQNFNKAIELNPKDASAYNNRGTAYNNKGQPDLAIQNFTRAIELDPQCAAAYRGRGVIYSKSGQLELAIQNFSKAIELRPQFAEDYYGRGVAYQLNDQFDLAFQDYSKAIEINPQYAESYYNRGLVYEAGGKPELAQKDFKKAIELNPKLAQVRQ
jgi:protein O-mannosyl-transferase